MATTNRAAKRFGIYVIGGEKIFVPSVEPLDGYRESEANHICNFINRQLGKLTVKIELGRRAVYPGALTPLVSQSLDLNSEDIFITKGEL